MEMRLYFGNFNGRFECPHDPCVVGRIARRPGQSAYAGVRGMEDLD